MNTEEKRAKFMMSLLDAIAKRTKERMGFDPLCDVFDASLEIRRGFNGLVDIKGKLNPDGPAMLIEAAAVIGHAYEAVLALMELQNHAPEQPPQTQHQE